MAFTGNFGVDGGEMTTSSRGDGNALASGGGDIRRGNSWPSMRWRPHLGADTPTASRADRDRPSRWRILLDPDGVTINETSDGFDSRCRGGETISPTP
ncbi:MAG: hypothetical protein R2705_16925 [Ilumatobacteraceae bacterium]